MTHDRDHYRAMPARALLVLAVEDGINPEMAIAIAEELARKEFMFGMIGQFSFNDTTKENTL